MLVKFNQKNTEARSLIGAEVFKDHSTKLLIDKFIFRYLCNLLWAINSAPHIPQVVCCAVGVLGGTFLAKQPGICDSFHFVKCFIAV